METVKRSSAGLLLVLIGTPGVAHHGVAPHYDNDRIVTIDGVVVEFDFINPHSFVYVEAAGDDGSAEVWQCELASRSVLSRNGLDQALFAPGAEVRIVGAAGRRNPTGCAVREAHFADGSVLRSSTLFGATLTEAADVPAAADSIEGTWAMKRFSVSMYEGVLTPAGERARAAFDPIEDDPAIYCDPASPVRFWVNVNEPFTIRIEEDRVVIDHQFMDSRRIVHLNAGPPGPEVPRSAMGYSTGHFDDGALVVRTERFSAATLEPRRGVMHTEDLVLTERVEVNDDGELEITWVIDDPAYFTEPMTQQEIFVRTEPWTEPYDCKPGYQQ